MVFEWDISCVSEFAGVGFDIFCVSVFVAVGIDTFCVFDFAVAGSFIPCGSGVFIVCYLVVTPFAVGILFVF